MVRYRRNRIAGATYSSTVTLHDCRSDLLVREIEALRQAWRKAASRVPHTVVTAVVLPDHLYASQENRARVHFTRTYSDPCSLYRRPSISAQRHN